MPWNIYTYIADVDEVITGQRREGIFAGIMTLTRKASQAGAVMLVGIVLQLSGFVSGRAQQSDSVQHTILLILSVGTLCVLAIGFYFPALSPEPAYPFRTARRDQQNAPCRTSGAGSHYARSARDG